MELKDSWWAQALELESEAGRLLLSPRNSTFWEAWELSGSFLGRCLFMLSLCVLKLRQGFQSMDLLYTPLPSHLPSVFLKCMVYCF